MRRTDHGQTIGSANCLFFQRPFTKKGLRDLCLVQTWFNIFLALQTSSPPTSSPLLLHPISSTTSSLAGNPQSPTGTSPDIPFSNPLSLSQNKSNSIPCSIFVFNFDSDLQLRFRPATSSSTTAVEQHHRGRTPLSRRCTIC
ncbi:hypothetical protein HanOQP8_Chr04g0161861 [Helianthus annuus]|nr:hypothetical protein HanHA89_Chr04g0163181 [Helianthus annuus]KAJ0758835.1 hypothetical protein HanLR1_Chr04g0154781 [Helianthus annuus]KAJ0762484.1 hypothetical protein HanOQP8_Chr04g0161861 [Helianthus annuus]